MSGHCVGCGAFAFALFRGAGMPAAPAVLCYPCAAPRDPVTPEAAAEAEAARLARNAATVERLRADRLAREAGRVGECRSCHAIAPLHRRPMSDATPLRCYPCAFPSRVAGGAR